MRGVEGVVLGSGFGLLFVETAFLRRQSDTYPFSVVFLSTCGRGCSRNVNDICFQPGELDDNSRLALALAAHGSN